MKHAVLLISALALLPFGAKASTSVDSLCTDSKTSAQCQAYISGVVDGYIASKKKYLEQQADFDNEFANRAYQNRVGYNRTLSAKAQPACLPDSIDTTEIFQQLRAAKGSDKEITTALGNYLREKYPCN